MNATLINAPRALVAATAALLIALTIGLLASTLADDLSARFGDRTALPADAPARQATARATWVHDPLASPLESLRQPTTNR